MATKKRRKQQPEPAVQRTRITPYTTKSGLQIGIAYQPPLQDNMTADSERLQRALIGPGIRPISLPLTETIYTLGATATAVLAVSFLVS